MKKSKRYHIILLISVFFLSNYKSFANEISLPNFGFMCFEKKTNKKFEFIFSKSVNGTTDIVFRRVNGKFKYIGNVLAQKSGAYVLWEDKIYFKTLDFAWSLDKVTSLLKPIILSVGLNLEKKEKIPSQMTCNSRSIYY